MVIKLILVFMACNCNVYVIPKSLGKKDLDYKLIFLYGILIHPYVSYFCTLYSTKKSSEISL